MNSDKELLFQWRADKEIRYLTMMHPYVISEEMNNKWINEVMNDMSNKNVYFAIEANETKKTIGYFTLQKIDLINRNAMLGIVIGNSDYRGKGLGKEIMQNGINYGFNTLGLYKIFLNVLENNESAIKLYKNIGFEIEGVLKQHYFFNNRWHNVIIMSIFNN